MRSKGAAPEGLLAGTSGGRSNSGNPVILAQLGLAPHVQARLEAEGIHSLEDWRRLCRRRFAIFGITRRTAGMLDAAAWRQP